MLVFFVSLCYLCWWSIWPLHLDGFAGKTIVDWLDFILDPRNMLLHLRHNWRNFILFAAVVVDSIWSTRNLEVGLSMCAFNLHDLQGYITRRWEEHLHTWALQQGSQVCNWTPPSLNVVKINCDAYVLQNKLIFIVVCRKLDGMLCLLE